MLTATVKQRLDVPGEDGQWVEIRKLPWRKLREAAEAQQAIAYGYVKTLGKEGMDAVRGVTAEQIEAVQRDASSRYDWGVLLRGGITAWSYSASPTPDEIDDQDPEWAGWVVGQILALAGVVKDEAASKNA